MLILLDRVEGNSKAKDINLKSVNIWVKITGLLISGYTELTGSSIGRRIGEVVEVDPRRRRSNEKGEDAFYMRVRVVLNVEEPLPRGSVMHFTGEDQVWVSFKYERLPELYLKCGKLTHAMEECPMEAGKGIQYGNWIRAECKETPTGSPLKAGQTSKDGAGELEGGRNSGGTTAALVTTMTIGVRSAGPTNFNGKTTKKEGSSLGPSEKVKDRTGMGQHTLTTGRTVEQKGVEGTGAVDHNFSITLQGKGPNCSYKVELAPKITFQNNSWVGLFPENMGMKGSFGPSLSPFPEGRPFSNAVGGSFNWASPEGKTGWVFEANRTRKGKGKCKFGDGKSRAPWIFANRSKGVEIREIKGGDVKMVDENNQTTKIPAEGVEMSTLRRMQ